MAIDFTLFLVPVDSKYIEAESLRWFWSKSGRQGAGDVQCWSCWSALSGSCNGNYPKSRDNFHSFHSSSHPMNVRLTILSCSASGQWGNSKMLIKFADQHFAQVLHTVHLCCERLSCTWFIIRIWVTVLPFSLLHICGVQTRPYSIHSLCMWVWSQQSSQFPQLLPLLAKFTQSQTFYWHKYMKSHEIQWSCAHYKSRGCGLLCPFCIFWQVTCKSRGFPVGEIPELS